MGKWNRGPLPPGEDERIETQVTKIHSALKESPKLNTQLSHIALDYTRPIRALRNKGIIILCERVKGPIFRYTLRSKQEPLWIQGGEITLYNGLKFKLVIKVNAPDRNTCRNRAQHGFAKVKLFNTMFIDPWLSPEAVDDLLLKMQSQLDSGTDDLIFKRQPRKRAKAHQ